MVGIPGAWSEDEGASSGREKESWRTGRWSGQKEPETSRRVWWPRQHCLLCCTAQTEAGRLTRTRPGSFSPASTLQVVVCICRCYFLHVPLSPPLTVSTGSFSVSPFPPCRWVHQCHLSRFHIYVLIYSICFSLSDLLHSV